MNTEHLQNAQTRTREIDQGLRAHMNGIYAKMTAGVLITALTAWLVGSSAFLMNLFLGGPQAYIVMFAPLAIIWFGFRPDRMAASKLRLVFFGLAVLYGISFSSIAVVASNDPTFGIAVAKAFFITTGMFAGISIFGYTTKKDLTPIRTFATMGIIGLIIAQVANMFFQSQGMGTLISYAAILLFSGITAWETQNMKESYNPSYSKEITERMGWSSALNLYISFIAIFMHVLNLMQQR
ncbi:MAG: Bax inhibitor-1/YccA family protein [Micavibrio sp.]|nr:Bax inhibitor-1/YccA family protein [Micavibrio sp.]